MSLQTIAVPRNGFRLFSSPPNAVSATGSLQTCSPRGSSPSPPPTAPHSRTTAPPQKPATDLYTSSLKPRHPTAPSNLAQSWCPPPAERDCHLRPKVQRPRRDRDDRVDRRSQGRGGVPPNRNPLYHPDECLLGLFSRSQSRQCCVPQASAFAQSGILRPVPPCFYQYCLRPSEAPLVLDLRAYPDCCIIPLHLSSTKWAKRFVQDQMARMRSTLELSLRYFSIVL